MSELYNWLFHYNHNTGLWGAFKRENLVPYFNGDSSIVIKSKSQKTLEELIIAYDGDIDNINNATSKK